MSVKIILSKTGEQSEKRELVFTEETISVGRESSNTIPLPGTQISKLHARIERQGSEYYIIDLNSTNSTYVNGERVIPGKRRALSRGDKVNISDYELEVFPVDAITTPLADPEPRSTMQARTTAPGPPAPGNEESPGNRPTPGVVDRWSRLTSEIQNTLEKFDILDFARRHEELQARCRTLAEENQKLKAELAETRNREEDSSLTGREFQPVDDARLEQLTRVLLQFFFKLSSGRSSFLSEFIVRTVIRTTSDLPMHPRSDNETLFYFTDPRLSDKEFAERLTLLKKEADQIVLHMIGILEGYRRSVDEGTRRILQRVDPDRLEEELPETLLLRYLPPLADLKLFRLVRNRLRDLLQEDRGVLEKQVFRPGFARAYEECVEPSSTKP